MKKPACTAHVVSKYWLKHSGNVNICDFYIKDVVEELWSHPIIVT